MLFYIKCPTCSRIISRNYDKYCKDLDDITNDPKLKNNAAERNKQSAALLDKYKIFKIKLLNNIFFKIFKLSSDKKFNRLFNL